MDTKQNIRVVKLLMRILDTNAPYYQTSVSFGFQNINQTETKMKPNNKKIFVK